MGDVSFGLPPIVTAAAYSNNFGGALTTVLRGVDVGRSPDSLVVHTDPNGGVLMTSLSLPFDSSITGYDISGLSGAVFFSATPAGAGALQISTV